MSFPPPLPPPFLPLTLFLLQSVGTKSQMEKLFKDVTSKIKPWLVNQDEARYKSLGSQGKYLARYEPATEPDHLNDFSTGKTIAIGNSS